MRDERTDKTPLTHAYRGGACGAVCCGVGGAEEGAEVLREEAVLVSDMRLDGP